MEPLEVVVQWAMDMFRTGNQFVAELFVRRDFGFFNLNFLEFFTTFNLTLFLGFAIIKWVAR